MKQEAKGEYHRPVLLNEAIDYLNVTPGGVYVDATLGGGGYAAEILKRKGNLIGIDCDPEAILAARQRLVFACPPNGSVFWRLARGNFKNIEAIVASLGETSVDGVVFDLGVSSYQLKEGKRGFSFQSEELLDMRMDPELGVTAADLVNALGPKELRSIFDKFGDEKQAGKIANAIVEARKLERITTCSQLAKIIERAKPRGLDKIHPATKVFQALRIVVNDEINNLKSGLEGAVKILKPGGRLVVISFHSGEDRVVKNFLQKMEDIKIMKIITDKIVVPSAQEIASNPRSRSARLRAGEKYE